MSIHEIEDFKQGERVWYLPAGAARWLPATVIGIRDQRVSIRVDGTKHPRGVTPQRLRKAGEV